MTDPEADLPPPRAEDLLARINTFQGDASGDCVVVLDDDPTGTQTVHDTVVLTGWGTAALVAELRRDAGMFYVLTNSRALAEPDAVRLARTLGQNLREAAAQSGRRITVVSRSDSTLRGHYPAEVDALAAALGCPAATQIVMPFFLQGGRLTVGDTHYLVDDGNWIPAAETAFAKDASFGFHSSDLKDWVAEKHGADFDRSRLHSISISELRTGDLDALAARLAALPPRSIVVVNAIALSDAQAFAVAARQAERRGATFLFRTAASFVQAYAGLPPRPILESTDVISPEAPDAGLIVVGSYVPKTTEQLNHLLDCQSPPAAVELNVKSLIGPDAEAAIAEATRQVEATLAKAQDVVLFTSRQLVTGKDAAASLSLSAVVSRALVKIIGSVNTPLRFLIGKGGITSSDLATDAMGAKRATVLGQILPGIPIWSLGAASRAPQLPFVVFPGNVGGPGALTEVYDKLRRP